MARRALITGITGQDGSYLAEFLLKKGYDVHGIARSSSVSNTERIDHILNLPIHHADMTDCARLREIVLDVQPDEIYNLAAQSHVHESFQQPLYTTQVNALAPVALLDAVRHLSNGCKFYQAATSEMYGAVKTDTQDENTPFHPRSPYACSKVFAFHQTVNYREAYGIFACNGILFNHESPRRGEQFVTRKITRAATRIKEGLQDKLVLGNLDAQRDWGFAGDYVEAMWLMLNADKPDDYVIATGCTKSVMDFLEEVFRYLELDWLKLVVESETFKRPSEVNYLCGNAIKARMKLDWKPKVTFKELARLMVDADWVLAKEEKAKYCRTIER